MQPGSELGLAGSTAAAVPGSGPTEERVKKRCNRGKGIKTE